MEEQIDAQLKSMNDQMDDNQLTFASIKEKDSDKRRIFVIRGLFKTRAEFTSRLKRELDYHEEYDFRTIKYHDIVNFLSTRPNIVTLDYLYEDLMEPSEATSVEAPVKK